jgi:hypothetical protein
MRTIENVVRAILREAGIKLGPPSRTVFVDRVREAAGGDASVMPLVTPLRRGRASRSHAGTVSIG